MNAPTDKTAPLSLPAALLLVGEPPGNSFSESLLPLLMVALSAAEKNEISIAVKPLRALLEELQDCITNAHWRANTLYEAGLQHIHEVNAKAIQAKAKEVLQ